MSRVIITGSSGYVASDLIPKLKKKIKIVGVDQLPSKFTDLLTNIGSEDLSNQLEKFVDEEIIIVNLAAARFDFGANAKDYYNFNVRSHENFIKASKNLNIKKFIHVSSVAAIDGAKIPYSENLNCDDAYRATKFLQEQLINKWCAERNIELITLYPSAIFSDDPRSDTNIGKLQSLSRFIPFIPIINVKKSLTYLPNFSKFILDCIFDKIPYGKYLTIEKPLLTVSEMSQLISGRNLKLVNIPFLYFILKMTSNLLYILGFFGKIDLKLTPNRVIKLYSDTSYKNIDPDNIDIETYIDRSDESFIDILANLSRN